MNKKTMSETEKSLYSNFTKTVQDYQLLNGLDNLVYLFSGGKDATIGLDYLQRYIHENKINITLDVVMVAYPLHVYFEEDDSPAQIYTDTLNYWKKRGIEIHTFTPEHEDFANDDPEACKICKSIRKSYIDPYLEEFQKRNKGNRVGVVTGYTLYDALAYMDEILLVSNFQNISDLNSFDKKIQNRVNNCLHKMKAKEELPNGLTVIRPLINVHENKVMDYILAEGIPYVNRSCKAAKDKHKREYFKTLNVAAPINNTDYCGLLNFLKAMQIEFPTTFDDITVGNYFTDC